MARLAGLALLAPSLGQARGWRLAWSDDFAGERLDPAKWSVVEDCWGGGNDERQCYTSDAVAVKDGTLRLTARAEDASGPALPQDGAEGPATGGGSRVWRPYASGKVRTAGKASFRYGKIEVRAKFPPGQGLWSAIWLLPEHDNYGPFPRSGEIDIAEAVNLTPGGRSHVQGARHFGSSARALISAIGTRRLTSPESFHTYGLQWSPRFMTWTLDGKAYLRARTVKPFDQRFHLIMNLAVGGRWPEADGGGVDPKALPATLTVNWVRVYEKGP